MSHHSEVEVLLIFDTIRDWRFLQALYWANKKLALKLFNRFGNFEIFFFLKRVAYDVMTETTYRFLLRSNDKTFLKRFYIMQWWFQKFRIIKFEYFLLNKLYLLIKIICLQPCVKSFRCICSNRKWTACRCYEFSRFENLLATIY